MFVDVCVWQAHWILPFQMVPFITRCLDLITICFKNKWKTKKIRWNCSSWEDWLIYSRVRSLLVKGVLFKRKVFKAKKNEWNHHVWSAACPIGMLQISPISTILLWHQRSPPQRWVHCLIKIVIRSDKRVPCPCGSDLRKQTLLHLIQDLPGAHLNSL